MNLIESLHVLSFFIKDTFLRYPFYFISLTFFLILSRSYSLLYTIGFNTLVLFAVASIYAISTLVSDIISKRDTLGKLRDGVHFFQSTSEARLIAANRGRAIRQFPLSSRIGWNTMYTAREKERHPFVRTKYIQNAQLQKHMDDLVSHVSRDFVKSWYSQYISPEIAFLNRVDAILHHALAEMVVRVEKTDFLSFIISKVFSALTNHIREFHKAERLQRAERLHKSNLDQDAMDLSLAKLYLGGSLHPAVSPSGDIDPSHLRSVVQKIIPVLLPKSDSSSQAVVVLVREILICRVLVPVIDLFSDPDYWNRTFESLADTMFPLESHSPKKQFDADKESQLPEDFFLDDEGSRPPTFEEYIKQIKKCDNLLDAFRIRDIIVAEVEKKTHEVADFDNDDIINGIKVSSVRVYINQLRIAQRRIDRRISALGGRHKKQKGLGNESLDPQSSRLKLSYILDDPHSLSFLTEFMDQRKRIGHLQYLINARTLREQLGLDPSITGDIPDSSIAAVCQHWDIPSLSEDIRSIWRNYFAPGAESHISDIRVETRRGLEAVVDILAVGDVSLAEDVLVSNRGLRYIFQAQQEIMNVVEKTDYPSFLKSSLCNQLITHFKKEQSAASFSLDRKTSKKAVPRKAPSPANVSDTNRTSESEMEEQEDWEARSSKRRTLNIIDSVFKRKKKSPNSKDIVTNENHSVNPAMPRITAGVENVEKELSSILDEENQSPFSWRQKAIHTPSQGQKPRILIHHVDDPRIGSLNDASSPLVASTSHGHLLDRVQNSDREDVRSSLDSLRQPTKSQSFDGSRLDLDRNPFLVDSFDKQGSDEIHGYKQENVKPLIIPPQAILNIQTRIVSIKTELELTDSKLQAAVKNGHQEDQVRQLTWMKSGMKLEYEQLLQEQLKLEREEVLNLVTADCLTVTVSEPSNPLNEKSVYPIIVTRRNSDNVSSSWAVNRSYSEFSTLHNTLRARYPQIALSTDLPGRNLTLLKKRRDQTDELHISLEKYLQTLVQNSDICKSNDFRRFICHPDIYKLIVKVEEAMEGGVKKSFLRNIFQTVDDGLDSLFSHRPRKEHSGSAPAPAVPRNTGLQLPTDVPSMSLDPSGFSIFGSYATESGQFVGSGLDPSQQASASDALIDLFIEIFELKEKNNWLRRQAVVLFLQQVFGGTVERRLSETIRSFLNQETATSIVSSVNTSFWPNGEWQYPVSNRTTEMKQKSRRDALQKLSNVLPEMIGNMVGRQNAKRGAARWCSIFQNKRLNIHLVSVILDDLLALMFPDSKGLKSA